jgi:hypothetical protein
MTDDSTEKNEQIKKCLGTLLKLNIQLADLKNLRLDGFEMQYVETSFMHAERIRSCLNTIHKNMQKKPDIKDQSRKTKHRNSRSIKP